MSTAFDNALAFVLAREGGYANDPDDPGGATNQGVTQRVYDHYRRDHGGEPRDVREIAPAEVRDIYYAQYWVDGRCHLFAAERPRLALAHMDACVNHGLVQAAKLLQRALGVADDGHIGIITLSAARACDEAAAVSAYLVHRAAFYRLICREHPHLTKFLPGWLARCRWVARATEVPIAPAFAKAA